MKTYLRKAVIIIATTFIYLTINCQEKNNLIKSGEIWPDTESNHINAHSIKNAFIFMSDRWTPGNLADSRHIWLPVEWEEGNPVIRWYTGWDLKNLK